MLSNSGTSNQETSSSNRSRFRYSMPFDLFKPASQQTSGSIQKLSVFITRPRSEWSANLSRTLTWAAAFQAISPSSPTDENVSASAQRKLSFSKTSAGEKSG